MAILTAGHYSEGAAHFIQILVVVAESSDFLSHLIVEPTILLYFELVKPSRMLLLLVLYVLMESSSEVHVHVLIAPTSCDNRQGFGGLVKYRLSEHGSQVHFSKHNGVLVFLAVELGVDVSASTDEESVYFLEELP